MSPEMAQMLPWDGKKLGNSDIIMMLYLDLRGKLWGKLGQLER